MKVVATTVRYDGIPRVVELRIDGPDLEPGMYAMTPSTWAQIEPCYAEKWTCILEYRDRDADEAEYERVKEVMKELEQM